ncbi:hypothetical protein F5Y11DRAFT_331164 [Daldinia sp. FL1419]|nr:hypothetical protein F5Y11DRAFT_331164 [Daldinia sp. FL1419]
MVLVDGSDSRVHLVLRDLPSFLHYPNYIPFSTRKIARFAPGYISLFTQDSCPVSIYVSANTIIAYFSCVISTPERPSLSELQRVASLGLPVCVSVSVVSYTVLHVGVLLCPLLFHFVRCNFHVCMRVTVKSWSIGDSSITSLAVRRVQVPGRSAFLGALFCMCTKLCPIQPTQCHRLQNCIAGPYVTGNPSLFNVLWYFFPLAWALGQCGFLI